MHKIFYLAIVLVAYAPISALADCALQELGWVVRNRQTAELKQYIGTPSVWNDTINQYVSFKVTTTDLPLNVYNTIEGYMRGSVGNATSTYESIGDQFKIIYKGDYDPTLPEPSKLQSLVRVLGDFPYPILANITCTQFSIESASGFAYIAVTIPIGDSDSQTRCNEVWRYLSEAGYLDSYAENTCFDDSDDDEALLEIWSTSCTGVAE